MNDNTEYTPLLIRYIEKKNGIRLSHMMKTLIPTEHSITN